MRSITHKSPRLSCQIISPGYVYIMLGNYVAVEWPIGWACFIKSCTFNWIEFILSTVFVNYTSLQAALEATEKGCVSTVPILHKYLSCMLCRLPTAYYGSNPGPRTSIAQGIVFKPGIMDPLCWHPVATLLQPHLKLRGNFKKTSKKLLMNDKS